MRRNHTLYAGRGHFDVGCEGPRLVEYARGGSVGQRDLPGIIRETLAVAGEARPAHELAIQPFDCSPVQRQDIVLGGLCPL